MKKVFAVAMALTIGFTAFTAVTPNEQGYIIYVNEDATTHGYIIYV